MLVERALSKGQLGATVWPGCSSLTSFVSSEKWVSSNHQPTLGEKGKNRDWRDSFLNCDPPPPQRLSYLLPQVHTCSLGHSAGKS